jgi:hypothetical protein
VPMRYWPKQFFQERQDGGNPASSSEHERSTRTLEDEVRREPIPKWAMAVLGMTTVLTFLWAYWLLSLVL